MAWLSGLTGKAENFLNSLDQTAAKVLQEEDELQHSPNLSSSRTVPHEQPATQPAIWAPYMSQGESVPASQTPSKLFEKKVVELSHDANLVMKPKTDQSTMKKKTDKDEALFEFLNSPEPTDRRKGTAANSTRHSRQSSASSVISNKGGKNNDVPCSSSTSGSSMVHVEMPGNSIIFS